MATPDIGAYEFQGANMATEHSVSFTLEVVAPPGWFLSIAPVALKVAQGTPAVYQVTTRSEGGYQSQIALEVVGLPAGVAATITPNPVAQDGTATLTIPTDAIPVGQTLALQLKGVGQ